jgi:hypothetical protein
MRLLGSERVNLDTHLLLRSRLFTKFGQQDRNSLFALRRARNKRAPDRGREEMNTASANGSDP